MAITNFRRDSFKVGTADAKARSDGVIFKTSEAGITSARAGITSARAGITSARAGLTAAAARAGLTAARRSCNFGTKL